MTDLVKVESYIAFVTVCLLSIRPAVAGQTGTESCRLTRPANEKPSRYTGKPLAETQYGSVSTPTNTHSFETITVKPSSGLVLSLKNV